MMYILSIIWLWNSSCLCVKVEIWTCNLPWTEQMFYHSTPPSFKYPGEILVFQSRQQRVCSHVRPVRIWNRISPRDHLLAVQADYKCGMGSNKKQTSYHRRCNLFKKLLGSKVVWVEHKAKFGRISPTNATSLYD